MADSGRHSDAAESDPFVEDARNVASENRGEWTRTYSTDERAATINRFMMSSLS